MCRGLFFFTAQTSISPNITLTVPQLMLQFQLLPRRQLHFQENPNWTAKKTLTVIFSHNTKRDRKPRKDKIYKTTSAISSKNTQQNVSTRQTRKRSLNYLKYSFETQSDFKETFLLFTQLTSSKSRNNCLLHLTVLHTCSQNNCFFKMVSARKKKGRNKRQFS